MKREIILAKNAIKPLQNEARSQDTNMSIQVGLYIHIENVILSFVLVFTEAKWSFKICKVIEF